MVFKQILKDWGLEALILFLFVFIILPYGPGITFDSVSFFQAGDHFWSSGKYVHFAADGSLEFAAHRFPLYPLLIGAARSVDWSLLVVQIILFAAFLASIRNLLNDLKSPKYFLLLLATFPVFLNFFAVWTESLYAVLFVVLLVELRKEEEFRPAIWLIAIVILLCFTRMVGIVVAGSLLLAYIIDKRPLRGLVLFISGTSVIITWTLLGTYYLGKTAREVSFNALHLWDLWYVFTDFGSWIAPASFEWLPFLVGVCLYVLPLWFAFKAWKHRHEVGVLFWFLIIHFYGYVVFVVLCKMFLDASIAFDVRTFFPLIVNYVGIFIVVQNSAIFGDAFRQKFRYIVPKLSVIIVAVNFMAIWMLRSNGLGYNSKEWNDFAFVSELESLDTKNIYTNDQAACYLYTENVSKTALLPQKMDLYSREKLDTYQAEMDVLLHEIKAQNAKIVWIRNGITGDVFPSYEELKELSELEVIYDDWLCLILQPVK
ncbi:MAG: hypothetical protein HUJ25_13625 [Crocinitomicaceae bacterium]|nr:hypothetical protein [Crocinitomicaceae bacterium]